MSASRRLLVPVVVVAGVLLAVPAVASATVYYAEHNGSASSGCLQVSDNCSLTAAITAARTTTTPDIVQLDAGDFNGASLTLGASGDADTTLQGSGAAATRLNNAGRVLQWDPGSVNPALTVSGLTLHDTATTGNSNTVDITSGTITLSNVGIVRDVTTGFGTAVTQASATNATVKDSTITTAGPTNFSSNGTLEIDRTAFTRTGVSSAGLLVVGGNGYAQVANSRFDGGGGTGIGVTVASDAVNQDAYATLEDVAIVNGGIGVETTRFGSGGGNATAAANLDHVTIVPASSATASTRTDSASADLSVFKIPIRVRNSILATAPSYDISNSHAPTYCDWTAVPTVAGNDDSGLPQFHACTKDSIDVANGGTSRHNVEFSASMINADGTLPSTSPAIDAGDPAALAPVLAPVSPATRPFAIQESTTDVLGNPRVARGTCTATSNVRDLGAYEYQGAATTASGAITGPDSLVTGAAGTFGYTSGGTIGSVAWDFGDGGTATAAAPTHTYTTTGTKTVSLTLTPTTGCPATVTKSVTVTAPASSGGGTTTGGGSSGSTSTGGGSTNDGGGPTTTPTPPIAVSPTLKVSLAGKASSKAPAKVTLVASAAGTVTATVTQKAKGYRKSTKATCGALKKGKKPNCSRTVVVVKRSFTVKAGSTTVSLALPKRAKAGRYSVSFVLAAGGKTSAASAKSISYSIAKKKTKKT